MELQINYEILNGHSSSLLEHAFLDQCRYSLWILTRYFEGIFDLETWLNYSVDPLEHKRYDRWELFPIIYEESELYVLGVLYHLFQYPHRPELPPQYRQSFQPLVDELADLTDVQWRVQMLSPDIFATRENWPSKRWRKAEALALTYLGHFTLLVLPSLFQAISNALTRLMGHLNHHLSDYHLSRRLTPSDFRLHHFPPKDVIAFVPCFFRARNLLFITYGAEFSKHFNPDEFHSFEYLEPSDLLDFLAPDFSQFPSPFQAFYESYLATHFSPFDIPWKTSRIQWVERESERRLLDNLTSYSPTDNKCPVCPRPLWRLRGEDPFTLNYFCPLCEFRVFKLLLKEATFDPQRKHVLCEICGAPYSDANTLSTEHVFTTSLKLLPEGYDVELKADLCFSCRSDQELVERYIRGRISPENRQ